MSRLDREFARTVVLCVESMRGGQFSEQGRGRLGDQVVQALRKCCSNQSGGLGAQCRRSLEESLADDRPRRNIIHAAVGDVGVLVSRFHPIGFSSTLGFEAFSYEPIAIPEDLRQHSNSFAKPVTLINHTAGLDPARMVALFPECWRFKDQPDSGENEKAWYFIDRFITRSRNVSLPLLARCTTQRSLAHLKSALRRNTDSQLRRLCAMWMYLHEANHRSGDLPYHEHEQLKKPLLLSSLEETRADSLAMVSLFDRTPIPDWQELAEFILLERVLRYPVSCLIAKMAPDYDSTGSHILLHFLEQQGVVTRQDDVLDIDHAWIEGIRAFSKDVARREAEVKSMLTDCEHPKPDIEARRRLAEFTCYWARYPFPVPDECRLPASQRPVDPFFVAAHAKLGHE